MNRLGFLRPFRKIVVLYPKGYTLYQFRLGKYISTRLMAQKIDNKVLKDVTDILVACPIQDIYLGEAPKLKYFDRSAFLFHTLNHQFKSIQWIASRWLSKTSFTGIKFSDFPEQNFDSFLGRMGAFLGEISRLSIFKSGEGCLLIPIQSGQIYELYIKNNNLLFSRLVDQDIFIEATFRRAEIDALKRYLERHFQTNSQTLSIKWWGPNPPDDNKIYQTQSFEESIVQNYVQYTGPFLTFKNTISPHRFNLKNFLKKLNFFCYFICLVLFMISIKNSFNIWELKNKYVNLMSQIAHNQKEYKFFEQSQATKEQIEEYKVKEDILSVLDVLKPLASNPLANLKKISSYVKDQVRCHELIWLNGEIAIDPLDHTLTLHSRLQDRQISSQSVILAITGPSIEFFKNLETRMQKEFFKDYTVKIWTKTFDPDLLQHSEMDENLISGLLEVSEKK